jgi:hypothetical protein
MPRRRSHKTNHALLIAAALALLVHVPLVVWFVNVTWLRPASPPSDTPIRVVLRVAPPEEEDEEEVEEEEVEEEGQIVEIAPPENPEKPEEADFLAEYDSTVPEETVDPRYRLDREVTAPTYSPDDAFELEEADGVDIDAPSTGAVSGRELFRRGQYSLFPDRPSLWDAANRAGLDAPAPVSHETTRMAGSPSNDWIERDRSDVTALNAHETLYASWWNRVKQLVSFYADQTLANARPSSPIRGRQYEMMLSGLIGADGRLNAIEIDHSSGVKEWDDAIKEAFVLAAPFPEPPPGALEPDGNVHMERFGFVITVGLARAEMTGIDPRQNVQFPGLQTVPR